MSEQIEVVSSIIPATPTEIFRAWLSGPEHAQMTGAEATWKADGSFSAWDGYILGRTLERSEPRSFVQTWRTSEFPDEAPDSRLEVMLEASGQGTRITLVHTELPDGQSANYAQGWDENYFEPMVEYFASKPRVNGKAPAKKATAKKPPAGRTSAKKASAVTKKPSAKKKKAVAVKPKKKLRR